MFVPTAYGAVAVTFMMLMYALEHRRPVFVAAFACDCAARTSFRTDPSISARDYRSAVRLRGAGGQ
jgi:hypothetical protein